MSGRPLDAREHVAAAIVGSVLGGDAIPRDVAGAGNAVRDFDVMLPNGEHIALEVTSDEHAGLRSMLETAYARTYPAPGLKGWAIGICNTGGGLVQIKKAAKAIPALLAVFEQHDIDAVDGNSVYMPPVNLAVLEAATQLFALGVTNAKVCPFRARPGTLAFYGHGGFSAHADQINTVVEQHALRKCRKLAAASEASERHLWIWVRRAAPDLAMHTQPPPLALPALPVGVEVAWVANMTERLWRVRPPDPWEVIHVSTPWRAPADGATSLPA